VFKINKTKLGSTRVAVVKSASIPAVVWAAIVPMEVTRTVINNAIKRVTKSLGRRAALRDESFIEIVI
jgi:hypothetical protein